MNKIYQKIIFLSILSLGLLFSIRDYSVVIFIVFSGCTLYLVYTEEKQITRQMMQYRYKKNIQLKEIKEEEKFNSDLLQTLITTMHMPMLFIDTYGVIAFVNESFIEAFNFSNIGGMRYQEVFTGQLLSIIDQSYMFQKKCNTILCNNTKYYQIDTAPLYDNEVFNGELILFTDVTQIKEVEQSQKQFFSNISKELKSPMSIIIDTVEKVEQDKIKDNDTFNAFMVILLKESYHMQNIIDDILELSRLDQPQVRIHPTTIGIEDIIKESIITFEPMAREKHISIIYQNFIKDEIALDATCMKTIISNLVSNAVTFSNEGVITIKTKKNDNDFVLIVQDEGIGIAQNYIPFIFDRFFQINSSKRKNDGTGLGLSIVKRMVELHGGDIKIESEVNIGSTFTITIPLNH